MPDSLGAFKLHSDTPNSALNSHEDPSPTQPYCLCTHCTHLFSFNHLPAEQGRSSGFHVQPQQSSRWSPTPAQLLYLEELYRQGTKTPTAQQIQQIASHLRQFGRIEGKNVFYWFQNHKARERQKRRRWEMETASASAAEIKEMYVMGSSEKQEEEADQGLRGTGDEVKETKKWASTSNCSGLAEVSASVLELAERGANVRAQFEEREIQVLRSNRGERQARCQNREMPCFTSIHLKNIATTATTSVVAAHTQTLNPLDCDEEEIADIRTLELFPHKRGVQDGIFLTERESKFSANASLDSEITSNQFFEFLPLKN